MLETAELEQIRTYVIKILPELLRADPEIATTIEGILAEQFPRRDEFARMLDELQRTREATTLGFAKVGEFQSEVRERFEQVDQRFEQVDQRFEQIDQRFEQIDQRFEKADKTMLGMRRDIAQLKSGQTSISKQMQGIQDWMNLIVGNLGVKKGQSLEGLVAAALRHGLKNPDIRADQIRMNQLLTDISGDVFMPGYKTEIDLIAVNGKLTVFEVKATAEADQVGFFALKLKLLQKQNPDKIVKGIFITLGATQAIQDECKRYDIELAS